MRINIYAPQIKSLLKVANRYQLPLKRGRRRHRVLAPVIGQRIDDVTMKDATQSDEDSSASRLILSCCTPLDSRRFLAVAGIRRNSFSFFSEVIWKE
ncbi:hypothetical protein AVEN_83905-1 [Araneus ventricosus]|uniref:Uncharacterized protein n=1 Tax=Araneus ventricosus TaxID=182803 RepID=A0A4Y2I3B2_ARAVE|nr:hypothetical protein AVEN_83905-1 [Araneus ventricosus]